MIAFNHFLLGTQEDSTLRAICDNIILPNIFMRESDEEAFEDNAIEFIRQDIEGSDSDTRVCGASAVLAI